MKLVAKLKKMKRVDLQRMAQEMGVKGIAHGAKSVLIKKILQKRKLDEFDDELGDELGPVVVSEPDGPKRKPEFEALIDEQPSDEPESEPEQPQEPRKGPGGLREPPGGRPSGATVERTRVERVLKNEVPDPAIEFLIESIIALFGHGKPKKVQPTPKAIALPVTNLLQYYFPNVHASPVLKVWFDLGIEIDALVVSHIQSAEKEPEPKPEPEPESENDG